MNTIILNKNIISFFVAFIISFGSTPIFKRLAIKYNIVDVPNQRKLHTKITPYLGGLAIFLGTTISILFFAQPDTKYVIPIMILALFFIMLMGLIDDIKDLPAKFRLSFLFLTATAIVIAFEIFNYGSPLTNSIFINLLILLVLIIWIVGITNAINWSDGLDGLATSQALISVIGFSILFWIQGRSQLSMPIALSLAGALFGFFPHNFPSAKIFMGDAGSMFIGFLLGILSIISINNETTSLALIVPIYLIMMPILDMSIVMFRRKINHKSMMAADKTHFHHILTEKFHDKKIVVLIISSIQMLFVLAGLFIYYFKCYLIGWVFLGAGVLFITFNIIVKQKAHQKK